jgi:hypothetical protein
MTKACGILENSSENRTLQKGRIYDAFKIHKQFALHVPQHGNNKNKTA